MTMLFGLEVGTLAGDWASSPALRENEVRARIDLCYPLRGGLNLVRVQLTGAGCRAAVDRLRSDATIERLEVVEETEDYALLEIVTGACLLPRVAEAAGVLPQFPVEVRDGVQHWRVVGGRGELRAVL